MLPAVKMRAWVTGGIAGVITLASGIALAQEPPPQSPPPPVVEGPPPPVTEKTVAEEHDDEPGANGVPKTRRGFQMSIRPGVGIPVGSLVKDVDLKDFFGPQFLTTLAIGAKLTNNAFVGGYLGLGFGGAGGKTADGCDRLSVSCSAVSVHLGVEAKYGFIPDGLVNPWLGYGIGLEVSHLSLSGDGDSSSATLTGFEFGHFMGGVDFRVSRVFGIGPFVDFSLAQFSSSSVSGSGSGTTDGSITDKALHSWLTIGANVTFFP